MLFRSSGFRRTTLASGPFLIAVCASVLFAGCDAGRHALDRADPLVVRVTGRDFHWYFTYPGADGEFDTQDDIDAAHNLHLPLGQPVQLNVTSEDYLYAFRAPELELTEVAVPGMTFSIRFLPERVGRFELEVDPMCGFDFLHANRTMGQVVVASEFDDADLHLWSN